MITMRSLRCQSTGGSRARRIIAGLAATILLVGIASCSTNKPGGADEQAGGSTGVTTPAPSDGSSGLLAGGDGEGPAPSSSAPRSSGVTPTQTLSPAGNVAEINKPCPYLSNDEFRDAEGDRVGKSVQLAGDPVGCRFYFEYDLSAIVGEIRVQRFSTPTEAFNAVVLAAKGHPEFVDDPTIGDHGSITIKLPLQGAETWACLYSSGDLVITAHTRQTTVGQDARNLAKLLTSRIT